MGGIVLQYHQVVKGRFLRRPNRFIAHVETEDGLQICHVKNTGRCRELLVPGAAVYLEKAANSARKTAYDLIAVEKGALLINMDAQAPNRVFQEWAAQGHFLPDLKSIQPEYHYGESRLDFALTTEAGLHLVEVKGVTLEENGVVRFPDAPTERGVKHIHELQRAVREGLGAYPVFCDPDARAWIASLPTTPPIRPSVRPFGRQLPAVSKCTPMTAW